MARLRKRRQKQGQTPIKRQRSKWLSMNAVVTLIIAALMILSIAGFIYSDSGSLTYNGYDFVQTNAGYELKYDDTLLTFTYHPSALTDLTVPAEAITLMQEADLVGITYTPSNTVAAAIDAGRYTLDLAFGTMDTQTIPGRTDGTGGFLPISCANATAQAPVILLEEGISKIDLEGNCIRISGDAYSLVQNYERVTYALLDIMANGAKP